MGVTRWTAPRLQQPLQWKAVGESYRMAASRFAQDVSTGLGPAREPRILFVHSTV